MSAKEEMIVECEAAKERIDEARTEIQGVLQKLEEAQATVAAVMGEKDPYFFAASETLFKAGQASVQMTELLDEAIAAIGEAGS